MRFNEQLTPVEVHGREDLSDFLRSLGGNAVVAMAFDQPHANRSDELIEAIEDGERAGVITVDDLQERPGEEAEQLEASWSRIVSEIHAEDPEWSRNFAEE